MPALRRLDIEGLSSKIPNKALRATQGRLHELRAHKWAKDGIARYCIGLRKLSTIGGPLIGPDHGLTTESGTPRYLLRAAGLTLGSLKIRAYPELTPTELGQGHELCPIVTSIGIIRKDDAG